MKPIICVILLALLSTTYAENVEEAQKFSTQKRSHVERILKLLESRGFKDVDNSLVAELLQFFLNTVEAGFKKQEDNKDGNNKQHKNDKEKDEENRVKHRHDDGAENGRKKPHRHDKEELGENRVKSRLMDQPIKVEEEVKDYMRRGKRVRDEGDDDSDTDKETEKKHLGGGLGDPYKEIAPEDMTREQIDVMNLQMKVSFLCSMLQGLKDYVNDVEAKQIFVGAFNACL